MTYYFTADEHYGHANIIDYCNRPFQCVEEMDEALIENHNSIVYPNDVVIHAGDFAFRNKEKYLKRLSGKNHIFIKGNHDQRPNDLPFMHELTINKQFIVVCHYAMSVWNRSHYGSWNLHGHSHGTHRPKGKQWDVGVDNNNYKPVSFKQLMNIIRSK